MSLKNLMAISALALLGSSATWAADYSAASLALNPSCVIYQGEDGLRAQVNGSVVSGWNAPEVGAHQVFFLDGQRYVGITDDAGYYTADVPVSSAHLRLQEGPAKDAHGHRIGGQAGSARCIAPSVKVGPLQSAYQGNSGAGAISTGPGDSTFGAPPPEAFPRNPTGAVRAISTGPGERSL